MRTREQELRAGVKTSGLSDRDKLLFTVILDAAQFGSADFKEQPTSNFIPSVAKLAKLCEKNIRTVQRGLSHLESHGWIDRHGHAGGRGRPSKLTLGLGERCECPKAGGPRKGCQLAPPDQPERVTTWTGKGCQAETPKGDTLIHVSADQVPVSTMGRDEGEEGREGLCTVCRTSLHPVLIREGYQTHPCCDPAEEVAGWPVTTAGTVMATFGIQTA
jgi:hypothetical protein